MANEKKPYTWWGERKDPVVGSRSNNGPNWLGAKMHMAYDALRDGGPPASNFGRSGNTEATLYEIMNHMIKEHGGRVIEYVYYVGNVGGRALVAWPDTLAEITRQNNGGCKISIASRNRDLLTKLSEYVQSIITKRPPRDTVWTIVHDDGSTYLRRLGIAGVDFEPTNYTPAAANMYNQIVSDLRSDDPTGRIAIIDGPPGTGKTYMLRSLFRDVRGAIFVLLPPGMAEQLTGPSLLPVLLNARNDDDDDIVIMDPDEMDHNPEAGASFEVTKKRLVLILEDADSALVPRGPDNMGLISALLNLSDGILGHMLDMRIVATTNAKNSEIDPAIKRPGRLSANLHIGKLDQTHALRILERLIPDEDLRRDAWFKLTDSGVSVPISETRSMGFQTGGPSKDAEYLLAEVYDVARKVQAK